MIRILMRLTLLLGWLSVTFGIIIFWFIPIVGILLCVFGIFIFYNTSIYLKKDKQKVYN